MRNALRGRWFAQRLENVSGVGTPDVVWTSAPASGVLELKIARGDRVPFRPGQIPWMLNWVEHGGRGHVLVWKDDMVKVFEGKYALDLKRRGISETPELATVKRWNAVLDVIKA